MKKLSYQHFGSKVKAYHYIYINIIIVKNEMFLYKKKTEKRRNKEDL